MSVLCNRCKLFAKCYPDLISDSQGVLKQGECASFLPKIDVTCVDETQMTEKFYLFIFSNGQIYEMTCGISFKDAAWEMSKYVGFGSEHLHKALEGFDSNDVEGILKLINFYTEDPIQHVYIVEKKLI